MLNNLLGTTALLVIFSLIGKASANETSPPQKANKGKPESKLELQISGKTSFNMIGGSQSQKTISFYDAGQLTQAPVVVPIRNQSGLFTVDGSKLGFAAIGQTQLGKITPLEFSLNIVLTGNTDTKYSVRESYLSFKSNVGTVLLGDTTGVDDRMNFGGRDTQVGTGGIDGNFTRFILVPEGVITSVELGYFGDTGDATKATYFTPRFEGFQLGASYTPNSDHDGEGKLNTAFAKESIMPTPFERNAFAVGLNYVKPFNDLKVSLSLTGRTGNIRPERPYASPNQSLQRHRTQVIAIGGLFEYQGWQLGAQYIWSGKSGQFVGGRVGLNPGVAGLPNLDYIASNATAANVFDVGLGYTHGDMSYSIGYLNSTRKTGFLNYKATANIVTIGGQYNITDGFVAYVEGANYNIKSPAAPYELRLRAQSLNPTAQSGAVIVGNAGTSQRANAVLLGTKIQF